MNDHLHHDEPGRVRLPKEVADQWPEHGYGGGEISHEDFYTVLWWIADRGYSIVPDASLRVDDDGR